MNNFGTIIKEAGSRRILFPHSSKIDIVLYDSKDRKIQEEVHFSKPLFADNIYSASKFYNFLNFLEESEPVSSMNIKIDEDYLIIFYNTPQAIFFKRTPARRFLKKVHGSYGLHELTKTQSP